MKKHASFLLIHIPMLLLLTTGTLATGSTVPVDTLSFRNGDLLFDSMNTKVSGRFTTSGGGDLIISEVVMQIKKNSGDDIAVSMNIYDHDDYQPGDTIIGTLTTTDLVTSPSYNDFTFTGAVQLDPDTTYWASVVWDSGGSGAVGRSTGGFLLDDPWLSAADSQSSQYISHFSMWIGSSENILTMKITAIPEPACAILALFGIALAMRWRRGLRVS